MTALRDDDTRIRAYLEDGPSELPDRSFDAVRFQIDHTRQRVVFGPRRFPRMNTYARLGVAAAAVLVVAVAGIKLLPGLGASGGPPTASPSAAPSATSSATVQLLPDLASPSAAPSATSSATVQPAAALPISGNIPPGTYYRSEGGGGRPSLRLTFTIPAGWTVDEGKFLYKDRGQPTEVMLVTWTVSHIFTDACAWNTGSIVDVGRTPDELIHALTHQKGRAETLGGWPWQGTIAGFPAEGVELAVPADLDTTTCTNGNLRFWPDPGPNFNGGLCCNPAGNIDYIYGVDVNGTTMAVVVRHYAGSSAQNLAELDGIFRSMEIQP
jgi:hypothetical protein